MFESLKGYFSFFCISLVSLSVLIGCGLMDALSENELLETPNSAIYWISSSGGDPTQLTQGDSYWNPDWLPDSTSLVVNSGKEGYASTETVQAPRLYRLTLDGALTLIDLPISLDVTSIATSPYGDGVLVHSGLLYQDDTPFQPTTKDSHWLSNGKLAMMKDDFRTIMIRDIHSDTEHDTYTATATLNAMTYHPTAPHPTYYFSLAQSREIFQYQADTSTEAMRIFSGSSTDQEESVSALRLDISGSYLAYFRTQYTTHPDGASSQFSYATVVLSLSEPVKSDLTLEGVRDIDWHPSLAQLVYAEPIGKEVYHIFIYDFNSQEKRFLCQGRRPRWSPDGKKVVFYD